MIEQKNSKLIEKIEKIKNVALTNEKKEQDDYRKTYNKSECTINFDLK